MSDRPKMMKLKNGAEEAAPLVATTMMAIEKLMETKPIVVYELVEVCKDHTHKPFGQCGDDLVAIGLLSKDAEGGFHVHESTRNVVLSAARGEGLELAIGTPRKDER